MPESHDDALLQSLRTLVSAAVLRLREREDLRDAALTLARWAVRELESPRASVTPDARAVQTPTDVPAAPPARVVPPPKPLGRPTVIAPAPLVETTLRIGDIKVEGLRVAGTPEQARAAAEAASVRAGDQREAASRREHPDVPDIGVVSARARLKAEACRWAVERRKRIARDADFLAEIKPTDASLVERAKATPDCYLWMLDPRATLAPDAQLEDLAGCYETVALAAEAAREISGEAGAGGRQPGAPGGAAIRRDLYWLVAEAQSALRFGVLQAGQRTDRDQMDLFVWLRDHTSNERIFVERHMKVDDPADPANWRDLSARLEGLLKAWRGGRSEERKQAELRHKAAYHAQRLAGSGASASEHDWASLYLAIDGLLALGIPPSNREITDLLASVRDVPAPATIAVSPAVRQAIAAAERLVEQLSENEDDADGPAERERSAEALEAAELLRGKVAVFIGGERRREAQERLERELELAELRWNSTQPHQSLSVFEPEIARPEVSVVLLAIRWSSHSYGELQEVCNRYGKILVRLPGGYSANQIATQVLSQAGERLRLAAAR